MMSLICILAGGFCIYKLMPLGVIAPEDPFWGVMTVICIFAFSAFEHHAQERKKALAPITLEQEIKRYKRHMRGLK